jgi:hypothetical protein
VSGIIEGFTDDIGRAVIRDVATATANAMLAKGLIQQSDVANTVGSINFLGDIALKAYLDGKL